MVCKRLAMGLIFSVLICMQTSDTYAGPRIGDRKKQFKGIEAAMRQSTNLEISEKSTLKDYIKIGLERNPGLKAYFYEWKADFKKISGELSLPDPQVTFTEYIEEVETRVGAQEQAFSIKQKFPLPDKLWIRKNRAFKASEIAYHNFEKKRLDLIFQITDAYYEYVYLHKAILLTKENMKLLKSFENVAQVRYTSGLQKNQDLLKAQVELGKLENELYSLKDLRFALVARLNALLNFSKYDTLPWPDESLEDTSLGSEYLDINILVEALKKSNPQLRALLENIEKNKESLKLSKREFFPDLTVGLTQIDTGGALKSGTIDSGKDPIMLTFSVNVPIWFNRLNADVQDARASLEAAENQLLDKENELLSRLVLVHYKLKDALRQSKLYKDALIPKAAQSLNATRSGYEAGGVDFLSLIDAQRVLLSFQLAYYRYNANFHQRFSELETLLGEVSLDGQEEFLKP